MKKIYYSFVTFLFGSLIIGLALCCQYLMNDGPDFIKNSTMDVVESKVATPEEVVNVPTGRTYNPLLIIVFVVGTITFIICWCYFMGFFD